MAGFGPFLRFLTAIFLVVFAQPVLARTKALPPALAPGAAAPDFSRANLEGKIVSLHALRGKVVLIDFWASWCAPCIVSIPDLIALKNRFGAKGFEVVGISMDDSKPPVSALSHRFSFNYPIVMGDARLALRYGGIFGLPVELLIGRNGKVIQIWNGGEASAKLERAVKSAL